MKRSLLCAAACLAAAVLLTGCQGAASSSASASSETEINQEMPDYSLGLTDEGLFDGVDVTGLRHPAGLPAGSLRRGLHHRL